MYSYDEGSSSWKLIGVPLNGESSGQQAGWAVSLSADGKIVAVGTHPGNGDRRGHVWVYRHDLENLEDEWALLGSALMVHKKPRYQDGL